MSTKKILKIAEKVHEKFPQISIIEMIEIWCEQQDIPFSISEESETETLREMWCKQLTNISSKEILNLLKRCMRDSQKFQ